MDCFGDSFVPNGVPDPAADFLAREQSELAGIDDIPISAPAVQEATLADDDQLISQDLDVNGSENIVAEEPPAIAVGDDQVISQDLGSMSLGDATVCAPTEPMERAVTPVPRIEPEPIRLWREEHQQRLVAKDAAEEEAREALRHKARQELDDWYQQHDDQLSKTRHANRCAEKELLDDAEKPEAGAEWERISKLCDFGPKSTRISRDVSRMRSIILQVKQSPPVKA